MSVLPKRMLLLLFICCCSLVNLMGYLYYSSSPIYPTIAAGDCNNISSHYLYRSLTAPADHGESSGNSTRSVQRRMLEVQGMSKPPENHTSSGISQPFKKSLSHFVRKDEGNPPSVNTVKARVDSRAVSIYSQGKHASLSMDKVDRGATTPPPAASIPTLAKKVASSTRDLDAVFQNFSISFDDLRHGQKVSPNNDNVSFMKFVVTLRRTEETTLSAGNVSVIPVTTPQPVIHYPNPHPYEYLINQPLMCSDNTTDILVIIVVCSGLGNNEARVAIRDTWGSQAQLKQWKAKLVFLVGGTNDAELQNRIQNESDRFQDIIQENFMDTYRNLSLKSVAMLKWVGTHCLKTKFVLKTDDDMFINTKMLYSALSKTQAKRALMGAVIVGARPVQTKTSKWYTPKKDFPDRMYPKYCSGTAYVISTDIVQELFNVTLYTPLFWLEDIYITGLCARQIKPRYVWTPGFTFIKRPATGCSFQSAISGHKVTSKDMYKIWKELQNLKVKCPSKRRKPVLRKLLPVAGHKLRIIRKPHNAASGFRQRLSVKVSSFQ